MVLVFNIVGRRDYKGHGVSPQQTLTGFNTSEDATTRTILRDSWNNTAVKDKIGNYGTLIIDYLSNEYFYLQVYKRVIIVYSHTKENGH